MIKKCLVGLFAFLMLSVPVVRAEQNYNDSSTTTYILEHQDEFDHETVENAKAELAHKVALMNARKKHPNLMFMLESMQDSMRYH